MFPGYTAEQLFHPATPELLYTSGHPNGHTPPGGATSGPPVFAALSVGIRPFIEQAFQRDHVSVDFAGFSGETLHGVIQEPLDKIRIGRTKLASITIRRLLPDTTRPMVLPCRAGDLADDSGLRARMTRLTARHAHAITASVQELAALGIVPDAKAEIRAHGCALMFKLYVLNGEEAFFGLYPILRATRSCCMAARRTSTTRWAKTPWSSTTPPTAATPPTKLARLRQNLVHHHAEHHELRVPRMTTPDETTLDQVIARTRHLLLDFDGPICDIFAGLPDHTVADRLRELITSQGIAIPEDVAATRDPIAVFIYSATITPDLAARVEAEMTEQEIAAVPVARPTAYVHDVVTSCRDSGRTVAVVSNNSDRAVRSYLQFHGLDDRVDLVVARTGSDPALLNPASTSSTSLSASSQPNPASVS